MKVAAVFLTYILSIFCSIYGFSVYTVELDDLAITPITSDYIIQNLKTAEKKQADLFLIELNTPGGLLKSTQDIVGAIMNSEIPVAVYVSPESARAASAGVFITLSAHINAMSPSSRMGAAHPVSLGIGNTKWIKKISEEKLKGDFQPEETEEASNSEILTEKIMNDLYTWTDTLCKTRNRNRKFYRSMIEKSSSYDADEALKNKAIDYISSSHDDLMKQLNGRTIILSEEKNVTLNSSQVQFKKNRMNIFQYFLYYLSNPEVAYILLMLATLGLIFEFTHPGIGFPGIAGAIALIMALIAFQNLPINYGAVILIVLGVVLLIAEFYTPAFGLLTLGSVVCIFIGSLFLMKDPSIAISPWTIGSFVSAHILLGLFILFISAKAIRQKEKCGQHAILGETGNAIDSIAPQNQGQIFIHGEYWSAINNGERSIEKGDTIIVTGKKKNHLLLMIKKH